MIWIDGYPFDIAVAESYNFESEATQLPVEEGADVTDHVRISPLAISLECVVSDTPIGRVASDPTRNPAAIEIDDEDTTELSTATLPSPSTEAFNKLVAIRDARRPVTFQGRRGVFENMVLSFNVPDDISTSGGMRFTATLRQIQTVENRRLSVKYVVAVPRGKPKVNRGAIAALDKIGGLQSQLVFTVKAGRKPPAWLIGRKPEEVGTLVYTEPNGDRHYRAEQGALADGWVDATGYHAYKELKPTPIYVDPKNAVVDGEGNLIPQTSDYVAPLDKYLTPSKKPPVDPGTAWSNVWSYD